MIKLFKKMTYEQQQLTSKNIKLSYFIAHKWIKKLSKHRFICSDDIYSATSFGLCKAAMSFDKSKGNKFSTYATKVMTNEVLIMIRKYKKKIDAMSLEKVISVDNQGNEFQLFEIIRDDFDAYEHWINYDELLPKLLKTLPTREYEIIFDLFILEYNQPTVSKKHNLSQSYISRIKKSAIQKMNQIYVGW